MKLLKIENLHVKVGEKEILKGVNLEIDLGKTNALMGPNGSGKSTLVKTLMGHPKYLVTSGKILFDGKDITNMKVNERAKMGIFMSFQNPREISGVPIKKFLKTSLKELEKPLSFTDFKKKVKEKSKVLGVSEDLLLRNLNEGFSGGEKKVSEIFQMLMLDPKLILLDETDSGLDVDALKRVSEAVKSILEKDKSFLIITHHKKILDYVKPDKIFIMKDGRIVFSGDESLSKKLDERGYSWIENE